MEEKNISQPPVSFREAIKVWMRIGLLSFGGPAGQIAMMHRMLVEERKWVGNDRFLPGPEAQQLAIYIGCCCTAPGAGLPQGSCSLSPACRPSWP